MRLHHPARCVCGHECAEGENVRMEGRDVCLPRERIKTWHVVACPACDQSLSMVADTGSGMKKPGSNLAVRIERARKRREKEMKRP